MYHNTPMAWSINHLMVRLWSWNLNLFLFTLSKYAKQYELYNYLLPWSCIKCRIRARSEWLHVFLVPPCVKVYTDRHVSIVGSHLGQGADCTQAYSPRPNPSISCWPLLRQLVLLLSIVYCGVWPNQSFSTPHQPTNFVASDWNTAEVSLGTKIIA